MGDVRRAVKRRQRLGWLLRVNRIHGTQPRYARLRNFAADWVRGGLRATVATFSRWETGLSAVPYRAVRRYEEVLGLPPHAMVSVIDTVSRYMSASAEAAPLLTRPKTPEPERRTEELVDRACGGDVMTAQDWDDLTDLLACHPNLVLSPRRIWTDLSERLLYETSIADGVLWMRRAEAFNRLIAHPAGQHAAISTVAAAAADRSVQSMVGMVSVFEASIHDSANAHVIRHLTDPTTDRTFYGALLASVRKLRYGHFSAAQLRKLVPVIVDILAEGRSGARLSLAATLLKLIPVEMRQRVNSRIWNMAVEKLEHSSTESRTVERLCHATVADVDSDRTFNDQILPHLVDELMFDPNFDVRLYSAFLLYSTPYHAPLGHTLGRELRGVRPTARSAVTLLEALRILGGPQERGHIERLVVAPGVPGPVRETAASALGHVGGASSAGYWTAALSSARQRWRRTRAGVELAILDRVIYSLGMGGRLELLREVAADPTLPDRLRSAASWWTTLPAHIQRSARV
ncbi:hypothetical protein [Actinophytocola sp.]|uniref:hypothetical protein n=1 Tax=Actinophytocola sp. TaxID=1872138 RepID=UPI002D34B12E|nr:hypothetical protein [Actinophytocola sp.]HYQ68902.1 hypothetical protein [Actinophytocola sp.]